MVRVKLWSQAQKTHNDIFPQIVFLFKQKIISIEWNEGSLLFILSVTGQFRLLFSIQQTLKEPFSLSFYEKLPHTRAIIYHVCAVIPSHYLILSYVDCVYILTVLLSGFPIVLSKKFKGIYC